MDIWGGEGYSSTHNTDDTLTGKILKCLLCVLGCSNRYNFLKIKFLKQSLLLEVRMVVALGTGRGHGLDRRDLQVPFFDPGAVSLGAFAV